MDYRIFGKTGLRLSSIGIGCNRIYASESPSHAQEIEMTLCEAIDRGINVLDTSNAYGAGDSERLIGRILRGRRSQIHICTKAGIKTSAALKFAAEIAPMAVKRMLRSKGPLRRPSKPGRHSAFQRNFSADYIESSIYGSLRRLKTDYLDIFLLHGPSPDMVSESNLFDVLARLKQKGIIRFWGVSVSDLTKTEDATAFLKVEGLSVTQIVANPYRIAEMEKVISLSAEREVGVMTREPFSKGEIFSDNRLQEVAAQSGRYSLAQMALRAAVQRDGVGSVIVGMRSRLHLNENLSVLSMPPLAEAQLKKIHSFEAVY